MNELVGLAEQRGLCAFARTVRTHDNEFVHDLAIVPDDLRMPARQRDA
jgi:hypothetical protein